MTDPDRIAPPSVWLDESQENVTLCDAALWVGCEGKELPAGEIAQNDLLETGATALFQALFRKALAATGIDTSTMLREPIPNTYWESARYGAMPWEDLHNVEFLDASVRDNGGFGGTLTPYGATSPRWANIQIDRQSLLRTFNFRAGPTIAGERSCQQWLESEMRQSLDVRPVRKDAYKNEAMNRFSVSANGFKRAWANAIAETGAAAWGRAGAPRKSTHRIDSAE